MATTNDLKAQILEAARRQPVLTRRQVATRVSLTLVSAIIVPVLVFLAFGAVRPGPRPWSLILATAAGSFGIALAAVWMAFGRGGQMLGRARVRLVAMAIAAPITFVIWKLLWSSEYDGMTDPWPGRPGFRCLGLTMLLAAWPFLALASIRRGSDPTHPRTLGAALGVATGTCAAVLVDLWCPVAHPGHLLLGHVLPIAILGLVGVVVGDRILAVRSK
jgi:hypothetical protein